MKTLHLLPLSLCLLAAAAGAQPAATPDTERSLQQRSLVREQELAEIARARDEIGARRKSEEQACWQRFAVEDCLRQARQRMHQQELPLRQRELELRRQERQDKAGERMRAIEQKQRQKVQPAPVIAAPRRDAAAQQEWSDREAQARSRMQEQAERAQRHARETAARLEEKERQRLKALQAQQEKQQAAQERREQRTQSDPQDRAAPLPIPPIPSRP